MRSRARLRYLPINSCISVVVAVSGISRGLVPEAGVISESEGGSCSWITSDCATAIRRSGDSVRALGGGVTVLSLSGDWDIVLSLLGGSEIVLSLLGGGEIVLSLLGGGEIVLSLLGGPEIVLSLLGGPGVGLSRTHCPGGYTWGVESWRGGFQREGRSISSNSGVRLV